MKGEGSGATGNGTRQTGPERELSRFSYYYCHLLLYYHYYTLPSLCLCIFPFGHNWGLFLFMDYAVLIFEVHSCGCSDVVMTLW